MSDLNEQILEVRYKPNAKILDYRGSWAEAISEHMKLPQWRIIENRIDIYDDKNRDHAFVGFRNAGFVAYNTSTKNYFADKAVKLFKFICSLEGFEKVPYVERIGVRSRFCKGYRGSFDTLRDKYTSNYLNLTERAREIIGAKLLDIGGPLNFRDSHGNFNTLCGPMVEEQIAGYFGKDEEVPKVGLYFDIDYWLAPKTEVDWREILRHISTFANSSWERFDKLTKLILGE